MANQDLFFTLLEDYFIKAKEWGVSPEDAAKAILSSLKEKDARSSTWTIRNGLLYGQCLEKAGKEDFTRPLVEYLYLSFLIGAFLRLTDAPIKRILSYLDCEYILRRYQRFHSLPERRVIIHLILRFESSRSRRKEKSIPSPESKEEELAIGLDALRRVLPLAELKYLRPYFFEGAGEVMYRGYNPPTLFYLHGNEEGDALRRFIDFSMKEGVHVYSLVRSGVDPKAEITIRMEGTYIVVFAYSEEYRIRLPR